MSDQEIKQDEPLAVNPLPLAKKQGINISGAIIISACLIAGAIIVSGKMSVLAGEGGNDKLSLISTVTEEDFVRGNKDADVTIIEYADFSCPHCADYHPILKSIVDESEGRVRWVYRHFPIFNPAAAIASTCVGRLGGNDIFWKYSDNLYENQSKLSDEYYDTTAVSLGLDEKAFKDCISDPLVKSDLNNNYNNLKVLQGFQYTPQNVLIDKRGRIFSFSGALSHDYLKQVLETLDK